MAVTNILLTIELTKGICTTASIKQIYLKSIHGAGASSLTNNSLRRNYEKKEVLLTVLNTTSNTDSANALALSIEQDNYGSPARLTVWTDYLVYWATTD